MIQTTNTTYNKSNHSPTHSHRVAAASPLLSSATQLELCPDALAPIMPHERDTDDVTPAVTDNLLPEHEQAIFNTEDKAMSSPVRREHRNRIRRMILWLDEYHPDIAEQSVHVVVTVEEEATPTRYYQNYDDRDGKRRTHPMQYNQHHNQFSILHLQMLTAHCVATAHYKSHLKDEALC
jgi:hypothetical protein